MSNPPDDIDDSATLAVLAVFALPLAPFIAPFAIIWILLKDESRSTPA